MISELGHAPAGVLGIRLTELKHVIGLTKILELGHVPVGVLGREAVGVLQRCVYYKSIKRDLQRRPIYDLSVR